MNRKSIKGTLTEQNLLKAFMGESAAHSRYLFFAKIATEEGYQKISLVFEQTAANEMEHAKQFFKHLEGGVLNIQASYPAGVISTTLDNLSEASCGEYEEWSSLYPQYGRIAKEEGFFSIATLFNLITTVEKRHEERYKTYHGLLKEKEMFVRKNKQIWRCVKCGFEHEGTEAPNQCPLCLHPQSCFETPYDISHQ